MKCGNCVGKMDYDVEEGKIPRDFIEYDFAEDAMDFECQLAEAQEVNFVQTLSEPLSIGSHIICTGTPAEDLSRFAINIGCGDIDPGRSDIAVHFNVRQPQCYVVRNTRRRGKWGPEETTAHRLYPFKVKKQFTIEIVVDEQETLWAVDGEHYCSFVHRNPSPFTARWIEIIGIRDAVLNVSKTDNYPTLAPERPEISISTSIDNPPETEQPIWKPNLIAKMPKGVPEGYQLVVTGRLRPMLHSFAIDLMDGAREWPIPNVHLHVNVRAYDESQKERQLVVLNAWLGAWGMERRQRTARLVPGTWTTFRIVRGPTEWSVFADDILIGELEHRASPAGVKALRVRGDLYPETIFLCPASSTPITEGFN